MKYALLVAWREYAESAKAKGFWIGLFLMPVVLFLSIQAPIWLEEKATPVRYFVLVDQTGGLSAAVEAHLEHIYQQKMLVALKNYAHKFAPREQTATSQEFGNSFYGSVEDFVSKGGKDSYLKALRPHLKSGSPEFIPPRRSFQSVQPPADIDASADVTKIAEQLKPYLRGSQTLELEGKQIELSAAILIPASLEEHVVRPAARRPAGQMPPESQTKVPDASSTNDSGTPSPSQAASIGETSPLSHQIQFWSVNSSDPRLHDEIEHAINSEIRKREYLARGMDSTAIRQVEQTYAPFVSLNPKKEKGKEATSAADTVKQWAPSGFVYLLWLAIFVIVQMLLNNTIEEKSNRIIEVLLSSVTPGELMMGKLIGIAAIGLTMVATWMAALFAILSWKAGGPSDLAGQLFVIMKGSNLVLLFSVYFLLGYLMYAGFILSIGSVCNTIKEAQSYMGVLTMVMMVPLLTMTFIPKDPNGPLARLLSWIPLYTPFTMMNRAAADPPLIDLVGTLILLVASSALALWMSGKVFRIGILRTGQPPKVLEMIRWAIRRQS